MFFNLFVCYCFVQVPLRSDVAFVAMLDYLLLFCYAVTINANLESDVSVSDNIHYSFLYYKIEINIL